MSVQLFIITHNNIGQELLDTVTSMIDISTLNIQTISIPADITAVEQPKYKERVNACLLAHQHSQRLILCDVYGATPYNLIKEYAKQPDTKIITGLNLGMLLKAAQLTKKSLNDIAQQACQSAQNSIIIE